MWGACLNPYFKEIIYWGMIKDRNCSNGFKLFKPSKLKYAYMIWYWYLRFHIGRASIKLRYFDIMWYGVHTVQTFKVTPSQTKELWYVELQVVLQVNKKGHQMYMETRSNCSKVQTCIL